MAIFASESVEQVEIRERVKKLQQLFADDPEVARIDYRFDGDWSGDPSVFLDIVLKRKKLENATLFRVSRQVFKGLLDIIRSEELGMHSYLDFVSLSENGK